MAVKFYPSTEYDINKYAQALYNCRMRVNLNKKEFAKYIGVNISTYQRNERALVDKIPVAILEALHKTFGYPPEQFLFPANANCITTQMKTWLSKPNAIPYIINAYQQYENDNPQGTDMYQKMGIKFFSRSEYDINEYANALYNSRITMGMNIKEFAKYIKINVTTYQRNEHALADKISVRIISALCEKLDYQPKKFLFPVNPNYISTPIKSWLKTNEAIPYILNAYSQFKIDKQRMLDKKVEEIRAANKNK